MAEKSCSKCKKEFECCNDQQGCWCERYTLPPSTLEELKREFENCLCEDCLKEYAEHTR